MSSSSSRLPNRVLRTADNGDGGSRADVVAVEVDLDRSDEEPRSPSSSSAGVRSAIETVRPQQQQ